MHIESSVVIKIQALSGSIRYEANMLGKTLSLNFQLHVYLTCLTKGSTAATSVSMRFTELIPIRYISSIIYRRGHVIPSMQKAKKQLYTSRFLLSLVLIAMKKPCSIDLRT